MEETSNEALQDLELTVQSIVKQITKFGTLSGKRKTTRIAKIDGMIAVALEDAYDIF